MSKSKVIRIVTIIPLIIITVFLLVTKISDYKNANYYKNVGPLPEITETTWYTENKIVAHATGGIDGYDYTNSKEALQNTLNNGIKVVEVDFNYTKDGYLVCYHLKKDVSNSFTKNFTLEEFLNLKIKSKYTPMQLKDIFDFMQANEDLYIVIDTKDNKISNVVQYIVDHCENKELLNRLLIQCYHPKDKQQVERIYNFPKENYIFASYKHSTDPYRILQVCYEEGFNVITVPVGEWDNDILQLFKERNIYIYLHTINQTNVAEDAFKSGTHGIYTDFLFNFDNE